MNQTETTILTPAIVSENKDLVRDGVYLFVHYRGNLTGGRGQGLQNTPLGEEPKFIEGEIMDARIYDNPDNPDFLHILIKVTKSENDADVGREISIYSTRDIISLDPIAPQAGGRRRRRKKKTKRKKRTKKKSRKKKKKTLKKKRKRRRKTRR